MATHSMHTVVGCAMLLARVLENKPNYSEKALLSEGTGWISGEECFQRRTIYFGQARDGDHLL